VQYQGTGGNGKANFLISRKDLEDLLFPERPLLRPLLDDFATLFAVRYERKPSAEEFAALADLEQAGSQSAPHLPAWKYRERLQILKSRAHTHVTQLFTTAVARREDWPVDDCAKEQQLVLEWVGRRRKTKTGWDLSDRPLKKPRLGSADDEADDESVTKVASSFEGPSQTG